MEPPYSVPVSPRTPRTPKSSAARAGNTKLSGISKKEKPDKPHKSDTLRKSSDDVTFPELYLITQIGPKAAAAQFRQHFDKTFKNTLKVAKSKNPSWFSDSDSDSGFKMPSGTEITAYIEYMKLFSSLSPSSPSSSESGDESMSLSPRLFSDSMGSPRVGSSYTGGRNRKKTKKNTRKNKNRPRRCRSKKYTRRKKRTLKHYRK